MANRGEWNIAQFCLILIPTSLGYHSLYEIPANFYHFGGYGLIMNLLTMFIACFPALWLSYSLSGSTGKGLVGSLRRHIPLLQFSGWMVILNNLFFCLILGIYCSLSLFFISHVISPPSEMNRCDNAWNTRACVPASSTGINVQVDGSAISFNISTLQSSQFEYYDHFFRLSGYHVKFSEVLDGFHLPYLSIGTLFITWILVFGCNCLGPASLGVASYIVGPTVLAMILTLIIYGFVADNINSDFDWIHDHFFRLRDPRSWKPIELLQSSHVIVLLSGLVDGTSFLKGKCSWHYPRWLLVLLTLVVGGLMSVAPVFMVGPYLDRNLLMWTRTYPYYMEPLSAILTVMSSFASSVPKWVRCLYLSTVAIVNIPLMALLLLALQDSVIEMLPLRLRELRKRRWVVNVIVSTVMCVGLSLASLVFLTRPGLELVRLLVSSSKHLTALQILLLVVSTSIAFIRTSRRRLERIIISVLFSFFGVGFVLQAVPFLYPRDPALELKNVHLSTTFYRQVTGWVVAGLPLVLGLFVGAVCLCCSRRRKSCSKVVWGVNDAPGSGSATVQHMPLVEKH